MAPQTRFALAALPVLAVVSLAQGVRGDMISYSDSIDVSTTNWSSSITVPKFDPSLGILKSIKFTLEGQVEGDAKFESLDAAPATVTMFLKAKVTLKRPDLTDLVVVIPLVQTSDNVTAFDGVIDFGGTSGRTYQDLMGSAMEMGQLFAPLSPTDEENFVGAGENITLPVTAVGQSTGSGAGNLLVVFATAAGAGVTVTYEYNIPEPGTLGLLALGGLALLRRRIW